MEIENSIFIEADVEKVFKITNDISNWKNLFTEYEKSEVLEKREDYVKFKLTTVPDEHNKKYTWISERFINYTEKKISARRLDPVFPFKFMDIDWEYKQQGLGTLMIWKQMFSMEPESGFSDKIFGNEMNKNTKIQMQAIKNSIEAGCHNE